MDSPHGDRLPGRLDPGVRPLQCSGEDVPDGDQVILSEDLSQLVHAVRDGRPVRAQTLLMNGPVLLGDERAVVAVVRGEQRAQRVGIAGVERVEIGLRDRHGLIRGGGRTGGVVLGHHARTREARHQEGDQPSSSRPGNSSSRIPPIIVSRPTMESSLTQHELLCMPTGVVR